MTWRGRGLGSSTIFKNLMSPTPRRKWYLTTGRRAHSMVLDPIPQSLPVHFFGSRPQPPTSRTRQNDNQAQHRSQIFWDSSYVCYEVYDPNTTNSKSKMLHLVDAQGRTTIMYNTAERQSGTTRQSDFAGLVIYMSSSVSSTYHELEHPKRYQ